MTTTQHDKAERFRALHRGGRILVLPNAWDVASARLVRRAGAAAVATTSAGVAWNLGVPDGGQLDRERAVTVVARIASAVDVPVTADIEAGYGDEPAGVAATVEAVLAAGAVGVNIEDSAAGHATPLRPVEQQAARIAAARDAADAAGVALFVNARIDTFLFAVGAAEHRLAETLERAAGYLAAGADGIFVPGVTDSDTIFALVHGIEAPLNVMVGPGSPGIGMLADLGVVRASTGPAIALAGYAVVERSARELLTDGGYAGLAGGLDFADLNDLAAAT